MKLTLLMLSTRQRAEFYNMKAALKVGGSVALGISETGAVQHYASVRLSHEGHPKTHMYKCGGALTY